jgi:hypothetical protein
MTATRVGTARFWPLALGDDYDTHQYDPAAFDVWCGGLILLFFIALEHLYKG